MRKICIKCEVLVSSAIVCEMEYCGCQSTSDEMFDSERWTPVIVDDVVMA